MRKALLLLGFLPLMLFAELKWEMNQQSLWDKAKREHRIVMVFVQSSHCRWCHKMLKSTLSSADVEARLSRHYLLVRLSRDDTFLERDFPPIHGVPTIFFLDENHHILEQVTGYFGREDFLSYLDDVERAYQKQHPSLVWHTSVKEAFDEAKREKKEVMVMVEDPHCRWCKKMKAGALSRPAVQKRLQKYVLLRIQRANTQSMDALEGLHGPIPSFHLFSATKKPLDSLAGYYSSQDFERYLKELQEEY